MRKWIILQSLYFCYEFVEELGPNFLDILYHLFSIIRESLYKPIISYFDTYDDNKN